MDNQTKNQSTISHAALLHEANEFVKKGDYENFLTYCTEDTQWVFIGERILSGKQEVREYMKEFYREPPVFNVDMTIEDGNSVAVTGEIILKDPNGTALHYNYCDIWRFENGKIAALKAYVVEKKG
jgi:ketosteroid isomerase-like protein